MSKVTFFLFGIQSYCSLHFGIQSHIFILVFRATFSVWCLEPLFIFILAFRAAFSSWHSDPHLLSVWHSEPHFHFDVQSYHHSQFRPSKPLFLLSSAFRATSPVSAFRAIIPSYFGIQSHHFCPISTFRATVPFYFGVQSHHFCPVWRSESPSLPSLAFKATVSFQFGVQSHIFISAFRAITCLLVWRSEPHHSFQHLELHL